MLRAAILCLIAFAAAAADAPPHLLLLRDLVAKIPVERNQYGSSPTTIVWPGDGAEVANRSVCSSLIASAWRRAYGLDERAIAGLFGETWPEADDIHLALATGPSFTRVTRIEGIEPGDVIAIDYRSSDAIPTGHVLVVDDPPRRRAGTEDRWTVVIIDSSSSPHAGIDTRRRPDGTSGGGVGRGVFVLGADAQGAITGYQRSDSAKSPWHPTSDHPIAIGRYRQP